MRARAQKQCAPSGDGSAFGSDVELKELARQLFAVLSDGAKDLRYTIRRGFALRDGETKKPFLGSYTDDWRPARERLSDGMERDRTANSSVLERHIKGQYDIAIAAPSWFSLLILDIDRPVLAGDRSDPTLLVRETLELEARVAAIWRAFDFSASRQPVVMSTPGGGYHFYLPLCRDELRQPQKRQWPIAWAKAHVEHHLNQAGLGLRPGELELYPSGVPLRAPCGRGMALMVPRNPNDPDNLGFEPIHASWQTRTASKTGAKRTVLVRDTRATVVAFLDAVETARRPIEEWLTDAPESPAWEKAKWGPWGDREKMPPSPRGRSARYQHKVEFCDPPGGPSLEGGLLLFGAVYLRSIAGLLQTGLRTRAIRHDAALKLCWYWAVCLKLSRESVLLELENWLKAFIHESGTLRAKGKEKFVKETVREASNYLDRRVLRGGTSRGSPVSQAPSMLQQMRALSPVDLEFLEGRIDRTVIVQAKTILQYLSMFADEKGRVPGPVNLSSRMLEEMCGQSRVQDSLGRKRRGYVVAIEELERIGVLALHTDYSTGHHGRLYTCWFQFGCQSRTAEVVEDAPVLGRRAVEEGELFVLGAGPGALPRVVLSGLKETTDSSSKATWWRKMYERRAFTPAEFFDADERKILPGPFRECVFRPS